MLDPVADCNDSNVTDICECDTPKYTLLRWDENLVTEFGLLCGPKLNFALPDLFFNIGVTTACLLGVLMNSFQVRFFDFSDFIKHVLSENGHGLGHNVLPFLYFLSSLARTQFRHTPYYDFSKVRVHVRVLLSNKNRTSVGVY